MKVKAIVLLSIVQSTLVFAADAVYLGESADHLEMEQIPWSDSVDKLIGGKAATPEEFPGVFYTRQGNSRCTGTLVGARVVATAAHCVNNGASLSLTYKEKTYSGRCQHAPGYRNNPTADWALCLLTEAIPDPIAEFINTDGARLKVGDTITLMGYGCINSGGNGGNDGTLRVGSAPIIDLPGNSDYDIVTEGRSALCMGDSGGPSFFVDSEAGKRYQTAINSRGDIRVTSYLSSLHVKPAQDFYKAWATANAVTICGVHAGAEGCRE